MNVLKRMWRWLTRANQRHRKELERLNFLAQLQWERERTRLYHAKRSASPTSGRRDLLTPRKFGVTKTATSPSGGVSQAGSPAGGSKTKTPDTSSPTDWLGLDLSSTVLPSSDTSPDVSDTSSSSWEGGGGSFGGGGASSTWDSPASDSGSSSDSGGSSGD